MLLLLHEKIGLDVMPLPIWLSSQSKVVYISTVRIKINPSPRIRVLLSLTHFVTSMIWCLYIELTQREYTT